MALLIDVQEDEKDINVKQNISHYLFIPQALYQNNIEAHSTAISVILSLTPTRVIVLEVSNNMTNITLYISTVNCHPLILLTLFL